MSMLDLDAPVQARIQVQPPAVFQQLEEKSAPEISRAMSLKDAAVVRGRFRRGCACFGALFDGVIAAYGWVTFDEEQIGEMFMRFRLKPGEAYIWDCATLPDYRGRRLYTGLLVFIASRLQAQGIRRLWIGTDWDNLASQRGILNAGFRPVADMAQPKAPGLPPAWFHGRLGVSSETLADLLHALVAGPPSRANPGLRVYPAYRSRQG